MNIKDKTRLIQRHVGVADDGVWGNQTADALINALNIHQPIIVTGMTFAQRQIDEGLLRIAFPSNNNISEWVVLVRECCVQYGIDTHREVTSFLANIAIESADLTRFTENLNYSADALIKLFGRHRISIEEARRYGRSKGQPANQEMIANILYGGTWGAKNLGNTQEGDGWLFRGQGAKQITGRGNFTAFAKAIGMNITDAMAYMKTNEGRINSAGWFWQSHGLDAFAATSGWADDRKKINGGTNGLAEVSARADKILMELLKREKQ